MTSKLVDKNGKIRCSGKIRGGARCRRRTDNTYCPSHKPKMGRPTMYKPEYCEEITDYFDVAHTREIEKISPKTGEKYTVEVGNTLPTLAGFANKINVSTNTLWSWTKVHPDFQDAVTRAKAAGEAMLVANALVNLYNPQFSVFVAKNYTDMRDVKDVNMHQSEDEPRTPQEVQDSIAQLQKDIDLLEAQL